MYDNHVISFSLISQINAEFYDLHVIINQIMCLVYNTIALDNELCGNILKEVDMLCNNMSTYVIKMLSID